MNLRALVVDDEPGMRLGTSRVLRRMRIAVPEIDAEVGFEADEAESGAAAGERLAAGTYDLVLLDYKLPDTTGLELLASVRERCPDAPVIMITAFASLDVAVSATKNGAFDFLAKPFTPDELRATVDKAVRQLLVQRQARRLAEEKRRVRFEFLRVLAHELKAPLGAVESFLHIMRDSVAGDDIANYDGPIRRSLVRIEGMRKMIGDLLDLTRIESGELRREIGDVDLVAAARACIETFQPEAEGRGIGIGLDAPAALAMRADRSEIDIILNNHVSNAVKYNRDGGRVTVALERRDGGAVLRVADTGIGMTPAEQARLFEEFFRVRNEKTSHVAGSGLGLSTVRKLVLLYGGTIEVDSRPDQGTTFTVTLRPAAA